MITVVLHGDASEKALKALSERVRDELTAHGRDLAGGVAGVRNYEISIEVSEEALRRYGLSFEQVADAVGSVVARPARRRRQDRGGEILLRTKGQRYVGREFETSSC